MFRRSRHLARQGKKAIAFWVDPSASIQPAHGGRAMGQTVQDVMAEALDDWFRKHGMHRLAAGQ